MTKEFKQINVRVNNQDKGCNFKKAIEYAQKNSCDELVFYWSKSKRLSDAEFYNRLRKILPDMLKKPTEALSFEERENSLIVTGIL